MLNDLLAWFATLPPVALYCVLAFSAGIENLFPPLPSDTVVAFGSFIAARGHASPLGTFLATIGGNLAGAMFMYWVGARYGTERVLKRLGGDARGRERLELLHARYGIWAIAVSRFLPGVRAIVPPVAGALRIGAARALLAMGLASGLWYGGITYLAFNAGANFDVLQASIAKGQRWLGSAAVAIAVAAAVVWWLRRRRRK